MDPASISPNTMSRCCATGASDWRKRLAWGQAETRLYTRHRWWVEGAHGLAKTLHGMARAARRGLENMNIQALLTATATNLKRLAKAILLALLHASLVA